MWTAVFGLAFLHFLLHLGLGLDDIAPDLLTVALLLVVREVGMGTAAGIGFAGTIPPATLGAWIGYGLGKRLHRRTS